MKKRYNEKGLAGLAWLVIMATLSLLGLILGQQVISPRISVFRGTRTAAVGNPVTVPTVQAELKAFYTEVENRSLPGSGPEIGMAGYRLFDDFTAENASVADLVDDEIIRDFYREVDRMGVGEPGPELGYSCGH
jgi:hypothetical protein